MRQRFFTSSVQGRLIKNILCNTPIPIYDTVRPGDYIIKNCKYIYNISLIKCIKSGTLEGTGEFLTLDYTFYWGSDHTNYTQKFVSNTSFYDSETHEWLGNYLRAYRDMKGVNLMPFYNCFSGVYTNRFKLQPISTNSNSYIGVYQSNFSYDTYEQGSQEFNSAYVEQSPYKIFRIPVKLNRTYTIALDCDAAVRICPAFINHGKLIEVSIGTEKLSLTDILIRNPSSNGDNPISKEITNTIFIHPFMYTITSNNQTVIEGVTTDEDVGITYEQLLQRYEQYLYLLIQVPRDNDSGIVVLEGDYTEVSTNQVFSDEHVQQYETTPQSIKTKSSSIFIDSKVNQNTTGDNVISKCPFMTYSEIPELEFNQQGKLTSTITNITFENDIDYGYVEYYFKQGTELMPILINPAQLVPVDYNVIIYSYIPFTKDTIMKTSYYNQVSYKDITAPDPRQLDSFLDEMYLTKLSLLQFNDNRNYPFTETLIQYLLLNVIDAADEISDNIKRVQSRLGATNYPTYTYGAWNNALRGLIFNTMKYRNVTHMDTIGYVDKNVESEI